MNEERPLLAFFGHHKCASTWIKAVIASACRELGLRHELVHHPRMFNHDLRQFVEQEGVDFLSYTNADIEYVGQLKRFIGFHVIRDPRDICVSAYFSHRYSHHLDPEGWPELKELREELQRMSQEEGIAREIEWAEWEFEALRQWDYSVPEILEIKMEELAPSPYQGFIEIFEHLELLHERPFSNRVRVQRLARELLHKRLNLAKGLSIPGIHFPEYLPAERLLGIIWEHDFVKKSGGRTPGEEDVTSHYRKGVAGDWRNYFTAEHVRLFKQKYNDVLLKLGYEKSPDWQ